MPVLELLMDSPQLKMPLFQPPIQAFERRRRLESSPPP